MIHLCSQYEKAKKKFWKLGEGMHVAYKLWVGDHWTTVFKNNSKKTEMFHCLRQKYYLPWHSTQCIFLKMKTWVSVMKWVLPTISEPSARLCDWQQYINHKNSCSGWVSTRMSRDFAFHFVLIHFGKARPIPSPAMFKIGHTGSLALVRQSV